MATTNTNVSLSMLQYYDGKIKNWAQTEDATNLATAKKYTDDQIAAIPAAPEYSLVKAETAVEGFAASYNLTKGGVNVGDTINIPKDYLVKSASVKTVESADTPVSGYKVGDKYIDFVVNTTDGTGNESHIYLAVNELVDVYTAGDGIEVGTDNKISLVAQDGTKTVGGITTADYTSFNGAVTKSNANETAINAINDENTGILAQAKANTKALADGAVKDNADAIAAINDAETGIAATSKNYADSLNTAMSERVQALEDVPYATEADIDALFATT